MRISVVGLGRLGAPLAAVLSSKGHDVIGLDLKNEVVDRINNRLPPVVEPELESYLKKYPFRATQDYSLLADRSDVTMVIVPTPSAGTGAFSNEFVVKAIRSLGEALAAKKSYHLVVICSTVMPGSTNGCIRKALEESSGKGINGLLGLTYNPEFIALGSVIHDLLNPDMVLIGESDAKAGDLLEELHKTITDAPIYRMNLVNAEISKISVNAYITMKISWANQLGDICEMMSGADASVIVDAVGADSRIGRKYLTPGLPFAGPCFPRDAKAFSHFAKQSDKNCYLADATDSVNDEQIWRLVSYANDRKDPIGILGLAYKPGTNVIEESPSIRLAQMLKAKGREVAYFDPLVKLPSTEYSCQETASVLIDHCKLLYVMHPLPEYAKLFPDAFRINKDPVVVDCWNLIERGPWDETHIIRRGIK